eukprot:31190-Pelagococcus_subviridis.AAC.12
MKTNIPGIVSSESNPSNTVRSLLNVASLSSHTSARTTNMSSDAAASSSVRRETSLGERRPAPKKSTWLVAERVSSLDSAGGNPNALTSNTPSRFLTSPSATTMQFSVYNPLLVAAFVTSTWICPVRSSRKNRSSSSCERHPMTYLVWCAHPSSPVRGVISQYVRSDARAPAANDGFSSIFESALVAQTDLARGPAASSWNTFLCVSYVNLGTSNASTIVIPSDASNIAARWSSLLALALAPRPPPPPFASSSFRSSSPGEPPPAGVDGPPKTPRLRSNADVMSAMTSAPTIDDDSDLVSSASRTSVSAAFASSLRSRKVSTAAMASRRSESPDIRNSSFTTPWRCDADIATSSGSSTCAALAACSGVDGSEARASLSARPICWARAI